MDRTFRAIQTVIALTQTFREINPPSIKTNLIDLRNLTNDLVETLKAQIETEQFGPPDFSLSYEEKDLLAANRKIDAIKSLRARTSFGLKEAKEACDKWQAENMQCIDGIWFTRPRT